MARGHEAVVAALRVALEAAQKSNAVHWRASAANRWIDQLPGAWIGRWRHLRLVAEFGDEINRERFVGHVRAAIAYLEAYGSPASSGRKWWSLRRRSAPAQAATPAPPKPTPAKPINLLRVRKPMPGLH
jgi:hypothetical protein